VAATEGAIKAEAEPPAKPAPRLPKQSQAPAPPPEPMPRLRALKQTKEKEHFKKLEDQCKKLADQLKQSGKEKQ
jgi:hypothetical protein